MQALEALERAVFQHRLVHIIGRLPIIESGASAPLPHRRPPAISARLGHVACLKKHGNINFNL